MTREIAWAAALFLSVNTGIRAEPRLFQNTDKTKSFSAELTAYDAKEKRVAVRLKNDRIQIFAIDVLSEEDQAYVLENAERLAVGNDLAVAFTPYQMNSKKFESGSTTERIYPSGYTIKLTNRSKTPIGNLKVDYTVYYAVQGYERPARRTVTKSGTLEYELIPPNSSVPQATEEVEIVSGRKKPLFEDELTKDSNGKRSYRRLLRLPGGNRKDLLVGCRVDILVDGKLVKSVSEGTLRLPDAKPAK